MCRVTRGVVESLYVIRRGPLWKDDDSRWKPADGVLQLARGMPVPAVVLASCSHAILASTAPTRKSLVSFIGRKIFQRKVVSCHKARGRLNHLAALALGMGRCRSAR